MLESTSQSKDMLLEFAEPSAAPDTPAPEPAGWMRPGLRRGGEENAKGIIGGGSRKPALDIGGVEYADGAALGMLLQRTGQMVEYGGKALIAGANGPVREARRSAHAEKAPALNDGADAAVIACGG